MPKVGPMFYNAHDPVVATVSHSHPILKDRLIGTQLSGFKDWRQYRDSNSSVLLLQSIPVPSRTTALFYFVSSGLSEV